MEKSDNVLLSVFLMNVVMGYCSLVLCWLCGWHAGFCKLSRLFGVNTLKLNSAVFGGGL